VKKIYSRETLKRIARGLRRAGKKIVFTNGCFDLIHAGHIAYLEKAKRFGDILFVGLNSDSSVRAIKGRSRPLSREGDRLRVIAALEAVDYVTVFSEKTPLRLIRELRPHVLVKGADWKRNEIIGAKEVESWGGGVRRVPLLSGRSTSALIRKIQKL
jgi:D-beta-D-heptose 7-phosphate kinase/D-beta-D-heptose 1-phosphate adenosyltransferase